MSMCHIEERALLGRRSQRRQASGAKGSTPSTTERRERSILKRASSRVGQGSRSSSPATATLLPQLLWAGADAGEECA
jgi:hypothetical protein